MKKLALTLAIVLGLGMASFANNDGGGLFGRGVAPEEENSNYSGFRTVKPMLPTHNQDSNQPATPLGSGIAVLLSLGAAYAVAKNRKED